MTTRSVTMILFSYALILLTITPAAAERDKRTPKYSVTDSETWEAPIKSQVVTKIVVSGSITKPRLEDILTKLYKKAKETKGWKYHSETTNVYVYAYTSQRSLERGDLPVAHLTHCCGEPPKINFAWNYDEQIALTSVVLRDEDIESQSRRLLSREGITIYKLRVIPHHLKGKADYSIIIRYDDTTDHGHIKALQVVSTLGPYIANHMNVPISSVEIYPCLKGKSNERAWLRFDKDLIEEITKTIANSKWESAKSKIGLEWVKKCDLDIYDPEWQIINGKGSGSLSNGKKGSGKVPDALTIEFLKVGQVLVLNKSISLMPELDPVNALEALKQIKTLPVGTKVSILRRDKRRKSNSYWLLVVARLPSSGQLWGWINPTALIGAEVPDRDFSQKSARTLRGGLASDRPQIIDKLVAAALTDDGQTIYDLLDKGALKKLKPGLKVRVLDVAGNGRAHCAVTGTNKEFWTFTKWLEMD